MRSLPEVNSLLFQRYLVIMEEFVAAGRHDPWSRTPRLSLDNLTWMCRTGIERATEMEEDKASRWLGFVQGCLAMRGLIDVDTERDVTRPLFHEVYRERTGATPESLEKPGDEPQ